MIILFFYPSTVEMISPLTERQNITSLNQLYNKMINSSCRHATLLQIPSVIYSSVAAKVLHVQDTEGGTGDLLAASEGVTDTLQLNHSGGRLSAWRGRAQRPSHLFCHL